MACGVLDPIYRQQGTASHQSRSQIVAPYCRPSTSPAHRFAQPRLYLLTNLGQCSPRRSCKSCPHPRWLHKLEHKGTTVLALSSSFSDVTCRLSRLHGPVNTGRDRTSLISTGRRFCSHSLPVFAWRSDCGPLLAGRQNMPSNKIQWLELSATHPVAPPGRSSYHVMANSNIMSCKARSDTGE